MAFTQDFHNRLRAYRSGKAAFTSGLISIMRPTILAIVFVGLPVVIAIVTAFKKAAEFTESSKMLDPSPIDPRYQPQKLEEKKVVDGIMLGVGMPLSEYKDWCALQEEKIGRSMSVEEKNEYTCKLLPSFAPTLLIDDLLTRHMAYSAQTGSGKSELMMTVLDQQVARGGGMLIFEAKGKEGDTGIVEKAAAICEQHGRIGDLQYFSMDDAKNCMSWNPWVAKNPRSLISMAMALQPNDGERFFRDMNKFGLTAAILALRYQTISKPFSFKDLMAIFTDARILIKLHKTMSESSANAINAKRVVGRVLNFFIVEKNGTKQFNFDLYQSRFAGIAATVGSFTHSEYSEILNSLTPDIDIVESIESNKITIISVSTLTDPEGVSTLGQIFMADVARSIGELLQTGRKPLIPCVMWLDEYPSFKAVTHQALFQLIRAANMGLIISFQGLNFLKEESETFMRNVIGNTWNVMFSDIKDDETRNAAAAMSNKVTKMYAVENESESRGKSFASEGSGISHNKSAGVSRSTGFKGMSEELIEPQDMYLEAGEAILISKRETLRLRMPLVEFQKPLKPMNEYMLHKTDDRRRLGDDLWAENEESSYAQYI